ncbi:MAG TPA: cytochrome C oxidase subunit IV family protein [Thermoanaerobaculia bacterium]|jgi:cytochrome c oxidase subunit 4
MTDDAHHHPVQGVPNQHAGNPPHEPLGEHEHPTHHHDHDPAHDNSPEAIRKEIRKYMMVFGALAVLTIVTVAISRLHLPTWQAIALGLVVATVKGTLVAAFFMHLLSERKLIYAVLALTVFFFGVMIWGPWHQRNNAQKVWPGYDMNASQPSPATPTETHGTPAGSGH